MFTAAKSFRPVVWSVFTLWLAAACQPSSRIVGDPEAADSAGSVSNSQPTVSFTVTQPERPGSDLVNSAGIGLVNNITISWEDYPDVSGLDSYNIKIDNAVTLSPILGSTNVGNTKTYEFEAEEGVTYHFRVQAQGTTGELTPWSEPFEFIVDLTPPQAASGLKFLPDSATDIEFPQDDDTEVFLTWQEGSDSPGTGVEGYEVQWFTSTDCTGSGTSTDLLTETTTTLAVALSTSYTYNVKTIDRAGRESTSACSSAIAIVAPVVPSVTDVGALSRTTISNSGGFSSSNLTVTCSHNGYVGIFDNADDDEIIGWTAVLAGTPEPLTIEASVLASITPGDGEITLKVLCRSETTTLSAPDTSRVISLSSLLTGTTGSATGEIDIIINYPDDTADYENFSLRRLPGSTAPNPDCTSDGIVVYSDASGPFNDFTYTDNTGSTNGATYSYRACVTTTGPVLDSSNSLLAIEAEDLTPPPVLSSFGAVSGTSVNTIHVTLDFPTNVSDYSQVVLRRVSGPSAPSSVCNVGTIVNTYNVGQFIDALPLVDTTVAAGMRYSYRVCIYDNSNNLTNSQTVTNIMAYHGTWFNVDRVNCVTYCSGISRTNIPSTEGSRCASGENRPQSAIDTPVSFIHGCFGSCTSAFVYAGAESWSTDDTFCYGTAQSKDYDASDRTIACYCR